MNKQNILIIILFLYFTNNVLSLCIYQYIYLFNTNNLNKNIKKDNNFVNAINNFIFKK